MDRTALVPALALVGLLVALPVRAGDPPVSVHVETRRRYTAIVASGTLPAGIASPHARLRKGTASALDRFVEAAPDGSFQVELRTTADLLPDEYVFEVLSGDGKLVASETFRLGTPEEATKAREHLRGWLVSARRALRDIAAGLERAGRYHANELLEEAHATGDRPSPVVVDAQEAAWHKALDRATDRLRMARMDFSIYRREILLSPFADAGDALGDLFPAIDARRAVLEQAFGVAARGKDPGLSNPDDILSLARRSLGALDPSAAADDADWCAGPLGDAEKATVAQDKLSSPLGFTVDLPAGYTVEDTRRNPDDNPQERVRLSGPDKIQATIRVREVPDLAAWPELASFVDVSSWEEWGRAGVYKRLSAGEIQGEHAYRILASVVQGQDKERLLIIERAPASGKRLYGLLVLVPESAWAAHEGEIEKLAASFQIR